MDTGKYTPDQEKKQEDYPSFLVGTTEQNANYMHLCPRAESLSAQCPDLGATLLISLSCKTWSCPVCARVRIRKIAAMTREADPNRLLTLTVDPARWRSPREAFEGTAPCISRLMVRLRRKFGPIEYFRCTEVTRKGWPHYHLVIRSGFLPHQVVKQVWSELTGATIVDLRQVKRTFEAAIYITKYLSKLHSIPWTDRHLSKTKHFFPPDTRPKRPKLTLIEPHRTKLHPTSFLEEFYHGSTVKPLSQSCFIIDPKPSDPEALPL